MSDIRTLVGALPTTNSLSKTGATWNLFRSKALSKVGLIYYFEIPDQEDLLTGYFLLQILLILLITLIIFVFILQKSNKVLNTDHKLGIHIGLTLLLLLTRLRIKSI